MSIAEEWEQLKTELQRDAERLIARATGTVIHDRIEADLTAILRISDPNNDHELTTRRKIFDLLRTEWRTSVMDTTHFRDKRLWRLIRVPGFTERLSSPSAGCDGYSHIRPTERPTGLSVLRRSSPDLPQP